MTNEIFYAVFGYKFGPFIFGKLYFHNTGNPVSVEFDYKYVVEKINQNSNLLGFYHTHPNMPAYMSSTDISTMEGWCDSEGKNLLCFIEGNDGLKCFKCYNSVELDQVSILPRHIYCLNYKKIGKFKKFGKYIWGYV